MSFSFSPWCVTRPLFPYPSLMKDRRKKAPDFLCPRHFYRSITTQHCFCRFAVMLDIFPITFIVWLCWRCRTFALLLVVVLYSTLYSVVGVFVFFLFWSRQTRATSFITWSMCRELSEEETKTKLLFKDDIFMLNLLSILLNSQIYSLHMYGRW